MRRAATILSLIGVLGSAQAESVRPIRLSDDSGRIVELPAPAQRIVSLLPSLTESVCALQACDRLVGVDRASNWPTSVRNLPQLGGLADAQIEQIYALRPDLVLAPTSLRARARLNSLGLTVLALEPRTLDDIHRTLQVLGQALGKESAATRLWRELDADIDRAARRVPGGLRGSRVYFEVSESPHAAAETSFIGELLQRLQLGNAVPTGLGPFPALNPEFVVRAAPDIIMATEASVARMPARPGWSTLKALRQQQMCAFGQQTFDILMRPGPRLGEAAALLADCMQSIGTPPR
jgi:iron complex transport system substrate-binding protein